MKRNCRNKNLTLRHLLQIYLMFCFVACSNSGGAVDELLGIGNGPVGNPAISFSPSPYDFGLIQANSGHKTQVITIKNDSAQDIYFSTISGSNLNFTIDSTTCDFTGVRFIPGQSCTVTVTFSPLVGGISSMGLAVQYGTSVGNSNELTASGALSGTGVTPLIFGGITSIDQVKCSSLRANWTNVAGASNYLIFSGTNLVGTALLGSSNSVVSGLTPGATYTLKVQGTDALGIITATPQQQTTTLNPAPLLMTPPDLNFPATFLSQGAAMTTIDFDNIVGAPSDLNMAYTCYFDRIPDGTVATTNACSTLPGTATFNAATGVFNWTPNSQAIGPYEIKITASYFGECNVNKIFVADVRGNFPTTNLVAEWDVNFSDLTKPFVSIPLAANTWKNIATSGASLDGALSASTWPGKWLGDGTISSPYRLGFSGASQDYVNFGTGLNAHTNMTIGAWIKADAPTATDKVIFGNGGGSASGFALRQSADAGKLEFVVGNVDGLSGYQTILASKSPVAYWKLDEVAGTVIADSAGTATGTATVGVVVNQAGAVASSGKSAQFSGASTYITVPSSAPLNFSTGGFSVTAWIYPTSSVGYRAILGKGIGTGGNYNYLLTLDSGTLFPSLYMSGANNVWSNRSTIAVNINAWNHVVATYNPATSKLAYFINGVAAGNITVTGGNMIPVAEQLEIGTMINNGYPFVGKIDEVAIFNTALTPSDVTSLYTTFVSCRAQQALAASTWTFISTTFNSVGNSASLYVNGSQACTITFPSGITGSTAPFVVGAKADGSSAWTGEVAHLAVYNSVALSSTTDMFNTTATRFFDWPTPIAGGLTLHLNPARGNGTTFPGQGCGVTNWTDLSTNSFTGAFANFSACGTTRGWQGAGTPGDPHRFDFIQSANPSNVVNFPHQATMDNIANGLTIFAIMKISAFTGNYRAIIGKGNNTPNYGFLLTFPPAERKLSLYLSNNLGGGNPHATWADLSSTALTPGVWTMVAVTWDNTTNKIKYYYNGLADGEFNTTGGTSIGLNARPIEVGNMIDAAYPMDGSMGVLLVYDRALTLAEIQQNCTKYQPFISGFSCN